MPPFPFEKTGSPYQLVIKTFDESVAGEWYYGFIKEPEHSREYKGVLLDEEGGILEGAFANGKANGYGRQIMTNGLYEGIFVDGQYAKGKLLYDDKYTDEGEFKNNKMHGKGSRSYVKDGTKYVGDFVDDKFEGRGILTKANGNVYDGEWKNNLQNGYGTLRFPTGDKYEGQFFNGKMHGKGKKTWYSNYTSYISLRKDGKVVEGQFTEGNLNGEAMLTLPGGQPTKTMWKDNTIVSQVVSR